MITLIYYPTTFPLIGDMLCHYRTSSIKYFYSIISLRLTGNEMMLWIQRSPQIFSSLRGALNPGNPKLLQNKFLIFHAIRKLDNYFFSLYLISQFSLSYLILLNLWRIICQLQLLLCYSLQTQRLTPNSCSSVPSPSSLAPRNLFLSPLFSGPNSPCVYLPFSKPNPTLSVFSFPIIIQDLDLASQVLGSQEQ